MEELGPPHFDEADKDFATKIRATLTEKDIATVLADDAGRGDAAGRGPAAEDVGEGTGQG